MTGTMLYCEYEEIMQYSICYGNMVLMAKNMTFKYCKVLWKSIVITSYQNE